MYRHLSESRKALVALGVSLLTAVLADRGLDLDTEQIAWLTSVLTGVAVWAIPNRERN